MVGLGKRGSRSLSGFIHHKLMKDEKGNGSTEFVINSLFDWKLV